MLLNCWRLFGDGSSERCPGLGFQQVDGLPPLSNAGSAQIDFQLDFSIVFASEILVVLYCNHSCRNVSVRVIWMLSQQVGFDSAERKHEKFKKDMHTAELKIVKNSIDNH